LDDVDDDELCRNPKRVNQVYDWALKAVLGASDMGQCRFVIANNLISNNSVLAHFCENPAFHTITVNALDQHGQPSWKEKYSREDIDKMIKDLGYAKAQSELFNNPIVEGAIFKQDWIKYRNPLPLKDYDYIISYCDPSFKNTDHSDYKAIITIGVANSYFDIIDAFVRRCTIREMVSYWYDMHESLPESVLIDYFMEGGLLMDMLFDEFVSEGRKRGFQLPLRRDGRKKTDKHARIEALTPLFERGFIHISNEIKDSDDTKLLIDQLLSFEKGSRGHDDAPDALEGGIFIASQQTRRRASSARSGSFTKKSKRNI
jgi:phage terminase large subunit-like protein